MGNALNKSVTHDLLCAGERIEIEQKFCMKLVKSAEKEKKWWIEGSKIAKRPC